MPHYRDTESLWGIYFELYDYSPEDWYFDLEFTDLLLSTTPEFY